MFTCTNTTNLGCYPACSVVDLPLIATQSGTHVAEFEFMGMRLEKNLSGAIGVEFSLDTSALNEEYEYKLKIKQPDGEYFADNDITCFVLKTFINKDVSTPE